MSETFATFVWATKNSAQVVSGRSSKLGSIYVMDCYSLGILSSLSCVAGYWVWIQGLGLIVTQELNSHDHLDTEDSFTPRQEFRTFSYAVHSGSINNRSRTSKNGGGNYHGMAEECPLTTADIHNDSFRGSGRFLSLLFLWIGFYLAFK